MHCGFECAFCFCRILLSGNNLVKGGWACKSVQGGLKMFLMSLGP